MGHLRGPQITFIVPTNATPAPGEARHAPSRISSYFLLVSPAFPVSLPPTAGGLEIAAS